MIERDSKEAEIIGCFISSCTAEGEEREEWGLKHFILTRTPLRLADIERLDPLKARMVRWYIWRRR